MNTALVGVCEKLAVATANGLYQGVLVTLLAVLVLRLLGRTNAATRHAYWLGVLLFVAALIPAHWWLASRTRTDSATGTTAGHNPPVIQVVTEPGAERSLPDAPAATVTVAAEEATTFPSPAEVAESPSSARAIPEDAVMDGESKAIDPAVRPARELNWNLIPTLPQLPFRKLEAPAHLPPWLSLALISTWALLAALRGGMIVRGLREIRRAKAAATQPGERLAAIFDGLNAPSTARRSVRLGVSSDQRTAVVLGFVHPVVLVPTVLEQATNDAELEHVLRHELAHVERRDDWWNLAQQTVQAALFFHPAVWWIATRLTLEREIACDDHVLATAHRPRDYALTLANLAGRLSPRQPSLSPGVSANRSQLQQRIIMILNKNRNHSPRLATRRLGFITTATALVAALALGAGPRLVLAQSSADTIPTPPAAPPAPAALPATPAIPEPPAAVSSPLAPRPGVAIAGAPAAAALADELPDDSGPRLKGVHAGYAITPLPPVAVVPATPAAPALAPVAVDPAQLKPVPVPGVRLRGRASSVEERLDRIERMLEELAARDGKRARSRSDALSADLAMANANANVVAGKLVADHAKRAAEASQITIEGERLTLSARQRDAEIARRDAVFAQRDAEMAKRDAEMAQRDAEIAARDAAKFRHQDLAKLKSDLAGLETEVPRQTLQALRNAHESLAKQMQSIERQMQKLEQDLDQKQRTRIELDEKPEPKAVKP